MSETSRDDAWKALCEAQDAKRDELASRTRHTAALNELVRAKRVYTQARAAFVLHLPPEAEAE